MYLATEKSNLSNQVAIKVVKDDGYAEREITILSELMNHSHPNIVKLLGSHKKEPACMRCLILSLARGPPLNYILKKRGALGLPIAQKIASQLVNTTAFLHGHGVIHRDIQPVSGGRIINQSLTYNRLNVCAFLIPYFIPLLCSAISSYQGPKSMTISGGKISLTKAASLKAT